MKQIEMSAVNMVLRMPTNSLSFAAINMARQELGCNLVPISAMLQACAIRAAVKTFSDIDSWWNWLRDAAEEDLPISVWSTGSFTPPGWSMASVVEFAYESRHLIKVDAGIREDVEIEVLNGLNNAERPLQREVMRALAGTLDSNWDSLLVNRLQTLCPGFVFGVEHTKKMWYIRLSVLSLENRIMALRSLCNGWATSYRYHEDMLLPCLFGCRLLGPHDMRRRTCNDEMSHYMSCPVLWKIVRSITGQELYVGPDRLGVGKKNGIPDIILAHHIYSFRQV